MAHRSEGTPHTDIHESRAAALSRLILDLPADAQASILAMLDHDEAAVDRYLFGASASGDDASGQPPAA